MTSLAGKRILVTRPKAQSAAFIEKLANLGAVPVLFPTIEIVNQEDNPILDLAINRLGTYHWVIFTSVNGVSAFWQRLSTQGRGKESFAGVHVAAIGPATAQALKDEGVEPDFTPEEYVAEAILPGLGNVTGQRILLPRADIARKALVEELQRHGAFPEEIAVYQTLPARLDPQALSELEKGIDIATFTSSSTVRNFFGLLEQQALKVLDGAVIACIGPITADTARKFGLRVDLTAENYTVDGLVEAMLGYESQD